MASGDSYLAAGRGLRSFSGNRLDTLHEGALGPELAAVGSEGVAADDAFVPFGADGQGFVVGDEDAHEGVLAAVGVLADRPLAFPAAVLERLDLGDLVAPVRHFAA